MLRVAVASISMLAALAGCGSGDGTASSPSPNRQSPTASPEAASRLEGTWETGPISGGDMGRTLRKHGLAKWVERFRPLAPVAGDTELILKIRAGRWDLFGKPKGEPRQQIDYDADYKVKGNTVGVSHEGDSNTYRWSVQADTLRLTWLDTTYGDYKGVPEEVFQRALYMTREFKRQT